MPARWKTGLALLAVLMTGHLGAEPLAPQVLLAQCAARGGPVADGVPALKKACPGIDDALTRLKLTEFMPRGWQKTLTATGLGDIETLRQRYAGSPLLQTPQAATLRSIAAALAPQQPKLTWFGRLRAWVRHTLLQPVDRWLRSLDPQLRVVRHSQAIFFGFVVLLLAAVVAVLAYELRGAGLSRLRNLTALPRRRGRIDAQFPGSAAAQPLEPDWNQLRAQPARILRLLVGILTRAHLLERERNLTCRELETQARFETETERTGFAQVALLAERELYGPPGVTVLSDETLLAARALYARLLTAGGKRGGPAR
jgi:hypothetical protein